MNDDILGGLDAVLEGIDAEPAKPASLTKSARAKRASQVKAESTTAAQVEETAMTPDKRLTHHGFTGKRVKIIIERSHDPKESHLVFLKLNDYSCTIERGREVEVPEELLGVLNDAEQTSFSQPQDGILIPHNSIRFPYRVIR